MSGLPLSPSVLSLKTAQSKLTIERHKSRINSPPEFREENLFGGNPVSETVEVGKRHQTVEVIELVKNKVVF